MKLEIVRNYYIFLLGKFVFSGFITLEDKTIDSFFNKLSKKGIDISSIGSEFVWNYIVYQLKYWVDKKTRFNGKIYSSWVFGDKAIDRWLNKNEDYLYFSEQFLQKHEINKPVQYYQSNINLDEKRLNFSSQFDGYLICIKEEIFSTRSVVCQKCKYFDLCKIVK